MNLAVPFPQISFKNSLDATGSFLKEVLLTGRDRIVEFVKDCTQHTEAIGILVLASLGLNGLIGELPFYFILPFWVEATMIIPVFSVSVILGLLFVATWRAKRRANA